MSDVPSGLKRGWRNAASVLATLLIVVRMRLNRFLREISRPAETVSQGAPKPADFHPLLETACAVATGSAVSQTTRPSGYRLADG
jgi:hypothetical protein